MGEGMGGGAAKAVRQRDRARWGFGYHHSVSAVGLERQNLANLVI